MRVPLLLVKVESQNTETHCCKSARKTCRFENIMFCVSTVETAWVPINPAYVREYGL